RAAKTNNPQRRKRESGDVIARELANLVGPRGGGSPGPVRGLRLRVVAPGGRLETPVRGRLGPGQSRVEPAGPGERERTPDGAEPPAEDGEGLEPATQGPRGEGQARLPPAGGPEGDARPATRARIPQVPLRPADQRGFREARGGGTAGPVEEWEPEER